MRKRKLYNPLVMTLAVATNRGMELLKQASVAVEGLPASTDNETIAAVYFRLSFQHLNAMLMLFDQGLRSSGFALLRPCIEAGLRGLYVELCMNEEQVRKAMEEESNAFGQFGHMVTKLQKALGDETLFSHFKEYFGLLSDYTHGGSQQILGVIDAQGKMTEVHADEDCIGCLMEAFYMVVYVCSRMATKHSRGDKARALGWNYNQFAMEYEPDVNGDAWLAPA